MPDEVGPLSSIRLKPVYRTGTDDISRDFLVPCFDKAIRYDRAIGFFSSTVYGVIWPGLREFLARGGNIRMICSPKLPPDDLRALAKGTNRLRDRRVGQAVSAELSVMLAQQYLRDPVTLLATMVASGRLECRIALVSDSAEAARFIFHDKAGVFHDRQGNSVVFKGSMNETYGGVANGGNIESIDVFVSWADTREQARVIDHTRWFELLWQNYVPGVSVLALPRDVAAELETLSDTSGFDDRLAKVLARSTVADSAVMRARAAMPHQAAVLQSWRNNGRRGIVQHATGSGKTFTAILAIKELLETHHHVLVLVPSEMLLDQWHRELSSELAVARVRIHKCGASHTEWSTPGVLTLWTSPRSEPQVVIAMMDTASKERFRARVTQGPHLAVIADEVHRIGSSERSKLLDWSVGPRLGLSATPQRFGDPEGTRRIYDWFGGTLEPIYGIPEAIRDERLCRYFYHISPVSLSESEAARWNELSAKAARLIRSANAGNEDAAERLRLIYIERARVVKQAQGKLPVARQILRAAVETGQRWLVYCDSIDQLFKLQSSLDLPCGCDVYTYYSGMAGDEAETLRRFKRHGGVVLSIRCLDEGVDIPAADHALIIASSKNPREFIQRRGRVLRVSEGKTVAHIHDIVVLPPRDVDQAEAYRFVYAEVARAIEFAGHSENPEVADALRARCLAAGIELNDGVIANEGVDNE